MRAAVCLATVAVGLLFLWYNTFAFYLVYFSTKEKTCSVGQNQLIDSRDNQTVKVITGIRRSGKSYLLSEIYRHYLIGNGVDESHLISVSLDLAEYADLRDPRMLQAFLTARIVDSSPYYVFIDEIQMSFKVKISDVDEEKVAPEDRESLYLTFYDVLNSLNARKNVDVYVTGSNSKMLSEDIATNFRGRRTEIVMHPLSFAEFYAARPQDKMDAWNEYMTYGGLPQVILAGSIREKTSILDSSDEDTRWTSVSSRFSIEKRGSANFASTKLISWSIRVARKSIFKAPMV